MRRGGQVWVYDFRYPAGRRGRRYYGTVALANITPPGMAKALTARLVQARLALITNIAMPRLSQMIAEVISKHSLVRKSARNAAWDHSRLAPILSFIGDRPINQITPSLLEAYIQSRRAAGMSPATVNRDLGVLRMAFNKMILWGCKVENPVLKVERMKEPPGRVRYLLSEEASRLRMACNRAQWWLWPIVQVARNTGMRLGEIVALLVNGADFGNRLIKITQSKTNRTRFIPMNRLAEEALWALCGRGLRLHPRTITRAFSKAVAVAQISDFRFHDLRHDAASWMTMRGAMAGAVQEILGHSDYRMTKRYTHLAPDLLKAAVDGLDGGGTVDKVDSGQEADAAQVLEKTGGAGRD